MCRSQALAATVRRHMDASADNRQVLVVQSKHKVRLSLLLALKPWQEDNSGAAAAAVVSSDGETV